METDKAQELFPFSQKTLQMLLYIIDKSGGKVSGKTKLIKLLFLVETEGKVRFDCPIKQALYGPFRDNEYLFARADGLIEEDEGLALQYRYIDISLTEKGRESLDITNFFTKGELQKAEKIIEKYQNYTSTTIKELVYKKYLDKYTNKDIPNFESAVMPVLQITIEKLDRIYKESDTKSIHKQTKLVGYLEHIKLILGKMKEKPVDKTERGVILSAIGELIEILRSKNFTLDDSPEAEEICDFIDNYAEVHEIVSSISELNFSDFTEDELKCVQDALERA